MKRVNVILCFSIFIFKQISNSISGRLVEDLGKKEKKRIEEKNIVCARENEIEKKSKFVYESLMHCQSEKKFSFFSFVVVAVAVVVVVVTVIENLNATS